MSDDDYDWDQADLTAALERYLTDVKRQLKRLVRRLRRLVKRLEPVRNPVQPRLTTVQPKKLLARTLVQARFPRTCQQLIPQKELRFSTTTSGLDWRLVPLTRGWQLGWKGARPRVHPVA